MPYVQYKYIPGDRKVECEVCGFVYRFSEMRRGISDRQKGLEVCPDCFDLPHPLDTVPNIKAEKLPREVR